MTAPRDESASIRDLRVVASNPEEDAVRRARDGDLAAFETLYHAHVGRVYAVCRRMCRDPHVAEELTQEAFVRAWSKIHTFRGEAAFATWLHRLAVNVVLGHLRRADRRREEPMSDERPELSEVRPTSPATTVALDRAVAALPDRARTVFILHDVEGYRHAEIARLADMAVGTSKAHLHRARRLLREALR